MMLSTSCTSFLSFDLMNLMNLINLMKYHSSVKKELNNYQ